MYLFALTAKLAWKESIFLHFFNKFWFNYSFRDTERQKEIANLEAQVYRFAEILSEQRAATRDNVQRKQARTGEEREDSDDEHFDGDDDDDDDDDIPYNPKNLPLGWDGKVKIIYSFALWKV